MFRDWGLGAAGIKKRVRSLAWHVVVGLPSLFDMVLALFDLRV